MMKNKLAWPLVFAYIKMKQKDIEPLVADKFKGAEKLDWVRSSSDIKFRKSVYDHSLYFMESKTKH